MARSGEFCVSEYVWGAHRVLCVCGKGKGPLLPRPRRGSHGCLDARVCVCEGVRACVLCCVELCGVWVGMCALLLLLLWLTRRQGTGKLTMKRRGKT